MPDLDTTAEWRRLNEARGQGVTWRKWGPYLSERQWGTVLEDYSDNGDAWSYFSHDQARSRAYRWGEDGLAGISDDKQRLCLAVALWDGRAPLFDEDRYFDVEVEHAKAGPEDIVCRVTVHNRSARAATLHVLPTLWFRNTWS